MSDLYSAGNVTVTGANGVVTCTGFFNGGDIRDLGLSDNFAVLEQRSGLGNTVGVVALDQRDDLNLTFYPLPSSYTAAGYKAIDLPDPFSVVQISSGTTTSFNQAGVVVDRIAKKYLYVGGGSIAQTSEGLAVMTLPLRKYAEIAVA